MSVCIVISQYHLSIFYVMHGLLNSEELEINIHVYYKLNGRRYIVNNGHDCDVSPVV